MISMTMTQLYLILALVLAINLTLVKAATPVGKGYLQPCDTFNDKDEDKCITGRGFECHDKNGTCTCRFPNSVYNDKVQKCVAPIGTQCSNTNTYKIDCANEGECNKEGICVANPKAKKNSASLSTASGFGGLVLILAVMVMDRVY